MRNCGAVIAANVRRKCCHMAAFVGGSSVASQALAAVETGAFEVLADDTSRYVRGALSSDLTALYPALASTQP